MAGLPQSMPVGGEGLSLTALQREGLTHTTETSLTLPTVAKLICIRNTKHSTTLIPLACRDERGTGGEGEVRGREREGRRGEREGEEGERAAHLKGLQVLCDEGPDLSRLTQQEKLKAKGSDCRKDPWTGAAGGGTRHILYIVIDQPKCIQQCVNTFMCMHVCVCSHLAISPASTSMPTTSRDTPS